MPLRRNVPSAWLTVNTYGYHCSEKGGVTLYRATTEGSLIDSTDIDTRCYAGAFAHAWHGYQVSLLEVSERSTNSPVRKSLCSICRRSSAAAPRQLRPMYPQVASSNPSRGARNLTEAYCGEGAVQPRLRLHVERSRYGSPVARGDTVFGSLVLL